MSWGGPRLAETWLAMLCEISIQKALLHRCIIWDIKESESGKRIFQEA